MSASESENPVIPAPTPKAHRPHTNKDWWPNQLDLSVLHQHHPRGNPLGDGFDQTAWPGSFGSLFADYIEPLLVRGGYSGARRPT